MFGRLWKQGNSFGTSKEFAYNLYMGCTCVKKLVAAAVAEEEESFLAVVCHRQTSSWIYNGLALGYNLRAEMLTSH